MSEEWKKDPRFECILTDPRFRTSQKQQSQNVSKRFAKKMKGKDFKSKCKVDCRGRPINLKRQYVASSDSDDATSEEDEMKEKKKRKLDTTGNGSKGSELEITQTAEKSGISAERMAAFMKSFKGEDGEATSEEEEETTDGGFKSSELEITPTADMSGMSLDAFMKTYNGQEDASEDEENMEEEDEDEMENDEDDMEDDEDEDFIQNIKARKPSAMDRARGIGLPSSSEDEDDEDDENVSGEEEHDSDEDALTDEDEMDHKWGEMNMDNVPNVEQATRRLAVCNMDWDRIKARDIFVVLNSYKPTTGIVKSVKVYPSEFGLERMKEEAEHGPKEIREATEKIKNSKNQKAHENYRREKIREHQLNRLRYYYAVVECDSPETAEAIYNTCDDVEYETSGTQFDLRYIPDDTSFDDQTPTSEEQDMPPTSYKPTLFENSAMLQSKVELTWEKTDPERTKLLCIRKDYTDEELDGIAQEEMKQFYHDSDDDDIEVDPYAAYPDPEWLPTLADDRQRWKAEQKKKKAERKEAKKAKAEKKAKRKAEKKEKRKAEKKEKRLAEKNENNKENGEDVNDEESEKTVNVKEAKKDKKQEKKAKRKAEKIAKKKAEKIAQRKAEKKAKRKAAKNEKKTNESEEDANSEESEEKVKDKETKKEKKNKQEKTKPDFDDAAKKLLQKFAPLKKSEKQDEVDNEMTWEAENNTVEEEKEEEKKDLTPFAKLMKKKEEKKKRKQEAHLKKKGQINGEEEEEEKADENLGFDDPFFTGTPTVDSKDSKSSKKTKGNNKPKTKRGKETEEEKKKREKKEALLAMMTTDDTYYPKVTHFSLKDMLEKKDEEEEKPTKKKWSKRKPKKTPEVSLNSSTPAPVDDRFSRFTSIQM